METAGLSQVADKALFFLFHILLCGLLGPFCPDAEEPGVGTGHAETGEGLEVLLLVRDDSGFLLLVDLEESVGSGLIAEACDEAENQRPEPEAPLRSRNATWPGHC